MADTSAQLDSLAEKFEKSCKAVVLVQSSPAKFFAAENDCLAVAGNIRDLLQTVVRSNDEGHALLKECFGGAGLKRFHRIRNPLESVELSEGHATDQRWGQLEKSLSVVEGVLKDLDLWRPYVDLPQAEKVVPESPMYMPGQKALYYSERRKLAFPCTIVSKDADGGYEVDIDGAKRNVPQENAATHLRPCPPEIGQKALYYSERQQMAFVCTVVAEDAEGGLEVDIDGTTRTVPKEKISSNLKALAEKDVELEKQKSEASMAPVKSEAAVGNISSMETKSGYPSVKRSESPPPSREPGGAEIIGMGDLVDVWSAHSKQWVEDGLVVDVITKIEVRDGYELPAGSFKIQYFLGKRFKWVAWQDTFDTVRKRKKPQCIEGNISKQTHNFLRSWNTRFAEVNNGLLSWWRDETRADLQGCVELAGLQMKLLDNTDTECVFCLESVGTKGQSYAFGVSHKAAPGFERWTWTLKLNAAHSDKNRASRR